MTSPKESAGTTSPVPTSSKDASSASSNQEWEVKDTIQDSSFIPTLAVFIWIGGMLCLQVSFVYFAFFASMVQRAVLLALYASSIILPKKFPGKKFEHFLGSFMMTNAEKYFGLKTTIEDPKSLQLIGEQGKGLIFAMEPHDLLPYTAFTFSRYIKRIPGPLGSNIKCLITSAVFKLPFIRQIYSYNGCVSVGKESFRKLLSTNQTMVFFPGGVQEVLYMDPKKPEEVLCYLKKRKGFVRLALETGTAIVPAFSFHLDGSYKFWIPKGAFFSALSRYIGFAPVLFVGRWNIPMFIPYPKKLHVVIGKPIEVPCEGRNTVKPESVEKYHGIYMKELEALYLRHRKDEGYLHREMKFI